MLRSARRFSDFPFLTQTVLENIHSNEERGYYIKLKEARGSFFGCGVEVLKLQSRIEDQLRSPSYYIMIST